MFSGSRRVKQAADRQRLEELDRRMAAIGRSQAVIEFDLDGTIRDANDNLLQTMGYGLDEIRGQHHRIFMDPAEAATPDYAAYRTARGWEIPPLRIEEIRLERDGERLMRQSQVPLSHLPDPRVSLRIVEDLPRRDDGLLLVRGPVTFRVDMDAEDKWLLDQSLYEVSFFLDRRFVSEEETGYTPLSWRWDPAGLGPGAHTMTVNISGFAGHVGVASVRFWVEPNGRPQTSGR